MSDLSSNGFVDHPHFIKYPFICECRDTTCTYKAHGLVTPVIPTAGRRYVRFWLRIPRTSPDFAMLALCLMRDCQPPRWIRDMNICVHEVRTMRVNHIAKSWKPASWRTHEGTRHAVFRTTTLTWLQVNRAGRDQIQKVQPELQPLMQCVMQYTASEWRQRRPSQAWFKSKREAHWSPQSKRPRHGLKCWILSGVCVMTECVTRTPTLPSFHRIWWRSSEHSVVTCSAACWHATNYLPNWNRRVGQNVILFFADKMLSQQKII